MKQRTRASLTILAATCSVVALIMMHVMIALTMDLHFTGNMAVALIFLVNVPYWFGVEGREPTRTERSASLEPAVT